MPKHIGFYSHIPFSNKNNIYYAPSYIGKYLQKISKKSQLVIFGHLDKHNIEIYDYKFDSSNIRFINIGSKSHSLVRFFFGFKFLLKHNKEFSFLDYMIVRSPSPLSFWFRLFVKKKKLKFLLVADEKEGAINKIIFSPRDLFIKYFNYLSDAVLKFSLDSNMAFVNSKALYIKYSKFKPVLVSTSNLESSDFTSILNFAINTPVKILHVGRIDLTKGILETLEAINFLKNNNILCVYNIVGWDDKGDKNIKILKKRIRDLNLINEVIFSGKKQQGKELNSYYLNSDIFICASYHESMPRTIFECMANSTAVIATKVGSIPLELENNTNALLINPKKPSEIAKSVITLIDNFELRQKLIINAFNLAKSKTITHSINGLIKHLN